MRHRPQIVFGSRWCSSQITSSGQHKTVTLPAAKGTSADQHRNSDLNGSERKDTPASFASSLRCRYSSKPKNRRVLSRLRPKNLLIGRPSQPGCAMYCFMRELLLRFMHTCEQSQKRHTKLWMDSGSESSEWRLCKARLSMLAHAQGAC